MRLGFGRGWYDRDEPLLRQVFVKAAPEQHAPRAVCPRPFLAPDSMLRLRPLTLMLLFATLSACSSDAETGPAASTPPASSSTPTEAANDDAITVVYLGDSLTAGYGLPEGEDQAYPALIQSRADSLGWNVRTVNAGVSGDTSAGGLRRVDWILNRGSVDVLVLALGANDGLRGLSVEAMKENLEATMAKVREKNPEVRIVLAGMMVPTNMGGAYGQRFNGAFQEIADEQDVELIPFLLEGVGGVRRAEPARRRPPDGRRPAHHGRNGVDHAPARARSGPRRGGLDGKDPRHEVQRGSETMK